MTEERMLCSVTITGTQGTRRAFYRKFDEAVALFAEILIAPGLFPEPVKEVRLREPNQDNDRMRTTLVYKFE